MEERTPEEIKAGRGAVIGGLIGLLVVGVGMLILGAGAISFLPLVTSALLLIAVLFGALG